MTNCALSSSRYYRRESGLALSPHTAYPPQSSHATRRAHNQHAFIVATPPSKGAGTPRCSVWRHTRLSQMGIILSFFPAFSLFHGDIKVITTCRDSYPPLLFPNHWLLLSPITSVLIDSCLSGSFIPFAVSVNCSIAFTYIPCIKFCTHSSPPLKVLPIQDVVWNCGQYRWCHVQAN